MTLNSRILAALNAGVDPDKFERCAVALMMETYKNVVPVEGGSDGGRDADIYEPIAGEPDSRGRILVTTGDSLDNLKSSHKTWRGFWEAKEPFRVDQIVMVTSNPLSDTKRRNILEYCRKQQLPTPTFYTRDWLVEKLRKHQDLRAELTGIRGRLEAIVQRGFQASNRTNLIGRGSELERLRAALDSEKDVVLVGLPGVGKTRLIAEHSDAVHYLEPLARAYLTDDLIETDPKVVVLDDAHLHLTLLEEVVRIRSREQLAFRILAVSWPSSESKILPLLPDPIPVHVERLSRPDLDEVIQEMGVHGIRARTYVLERSDGRPGWAELLSDLVVGGDGESLATGQPLLDQVSSLAHAISGSAALADALACIAALGSASLADLEIVADIAGVPYGDLVEWLGATAQGGLVERTAENWTVLRPLQTLIVAATFFGEKKKRQWATFACKFQPDRRLDRTILEVAASVPNPDVRQLADAWFAHAVTEPLDAKLLELVALYAQIGEEEAGRAATFARKVLDEPREITPLYRGVAYDPLGEAAEAVLRAAFRGACVQEATEGLLDLAITDHRPRHQHPNHPMRVLQESAQYLDPDAGPADWLRGRILTQGLSWLDRSPSESRWCILGELARYIFDPTVEGSWTGPGNHRTLTMTRGLMSASAMDRLLDGWDQIDVRVRGDAGQLLTHRAVAELCRIFDRWTSLTVGEAENGEQLNPTHKTAAMRGAKLVYDTLTLLSERFPAIPVAVNRQLGLVEIWNGGQTSLARLPVIDDRFARFVWLREPDDDIDAWMAERREDRASLANDLVALGATEGVAEYQRLLKEAEVLEGNHEGELLARELSAQVADAVAWLRVAVDQEFQILVGPMLTSARRAGLDVSKEVFDALAIPALRTSVLRTILQEESPLDSLARSVVKSLAEGDAARIGQLWVHDSVTPMLRELLSHALPGVRTLAAVTFSEGVTHGPNLPEDLRPAWRTAMIGAHPDHVSQHDGARLQKMLRHAVVSDPTLCADWFIANADALARERPHDHNFVRSLSETLRLLPREQKRRICASLSMKTIFASGFASELLASDEILTGELLENGTVDTDGLLSAMSGFRDYTIEAAAPSLVKAGVSPTLIAAHALGNRNWTDSEAASIGKDLELFATLGERRPELTGVCEAAADKLKDELEYATEREERERLLGW